MLIKYSNLILGLLLSIFSYSGVYAYEYYILSDIKVEGNKRTRPEIILREMTVKDGDTIPETERETIFDRNEQNIYNLGLFNLVDIIGKPDSVGNLSLLITVKERWYFFVTPGLVVEERNSYDVLQKLKSNLDLPLNEWQFPRFSYQMTLMWRNMTGRNERWWFSGQLGFSQRFQTEYFYPWLFPKHRIDFFSGVKYVAQKQIIYNTDSARVQWGGLNHEPLQTTYQFYSGIRKRFNPFNSLHAQISYNYIHLHDSILHFNPKYVTNTDGNEHYPSLLIGYSHDTRDIRSFPLKGMRYRFLARFTGYLPGSSTSFTKIGVTYAHYIPLRKKWFFSYGSQNVLTFGKIIPYFEKNFIWIDKDDFPDFYNDIRGYESYAVDAMTMTINKAEIKYALVPRRMIHVKKIPFKKFQDMPIGIYLAGFFDSAYVWDYSFNNQDNYLKNQLLYGYGIGVHVISIYDLMGRFEVSRNHFGAIHLNVHAMVPIK